MSKVSYGHIRQKALQDLIAAGVEAPQRTCDLLLQEVAGLNKAALLLRSQDMCPAALVLEFESYIKRRIGREPVGRILGKREFHGLMFSLGNATLEPRDDTECVIEAVLNRLKDKNAPWHFADMGTGSGAIALALLSELPHAQSLGVDQSDETLAVACANAKDNGFDPRFTPCQSDWFTSVDGRFDFIVSNPPYIASAVVDGLQEEVLRYDPRLALDGGEDGLSAYRVLLQEAQTYLKPDGFLALEIGYDQQASVVALGQSLSWQHDLTMQDLNGHDRALIFTF